MPVRVKLRVESKTGETVEVPALVNTGYSSEEPEVLIPRGVAETLNLRPEIYEESRVEDYFTVSGRVRLTYIPAAVNLSVLAGDRTVGPVRAHATMSTTESDVLISDKLADKLKISIIKAGAGEWRFLDDTPNKVRLSVR
ncbi:MAG: hypothetical protein U9O89_08010 [Thermoproteota archaeon]|nr:hypothetical protein [Thermoproteota archaeon]